MAGQETTRRVTREELYALVWNKPMSRLAEDFGISGNGLAKICDRLNVPYPPRGYWAKKEAGKPLVKIDLPPRVDGVPSVVDIRRASPKQLPSPEAEESVAAVGEALSGISVPETLDKLHPRVKAWISQHKKEQGERREESRRRRHESWWSPRLLPELTERDLYRFRVTSAIFKGIEKAGGGIEKSFISGKVTFRVAGQAIECSIMEKMVRSLKQRDEISKWTAYPDHHQSGLASSGFLRVSITTYVDGMKPQWIETDKIKIGNQLAQIVGAIMAAGPILERRQRKREEDARGHREEKARRYEVRCLKELDDKRWNAFREFVVSWEECRRILKFLAEIETLTSDDRGGVVADTPLSDWIIWAKRRTEAQDPLSQGVPAMFEVISKITRWS